MRARASRPATILTVLVTHAVLVLSVAACGDVAARPELTPATGAGEVVTEDRTAGDVQRISVSAPIEVVLRTGTPASVTLSAQANLLPLVHTEVRDGQLIVNVPAPGFVAADPVRLTVIASRITAVTLSGGARGELETVGEALAVDVSGAAGITGTGRVDRLTVVASSEGQIDFAGLIAGSASVRLSGGSSATLSVDEELTGDASAGATVTLTGPVPVVDVSTSSGGSVQGPSPSP